MTNRDTMDRLFRKHGEELFGYLVKRVGNSDDAYDLVQAAFLKLAENPPGKLSSPRAWLFTVARNLSTDGFRRSRRLSDSDVDAMADDRESVLDDMMQHEEHRELHMAMEALSESERELLDLRFGHGFSFKEMAKITGKSAGSVKVAVHRSKNRLKEIMEDRRIAEDIALAGRSS